MASLTHQKRSPFYWISYYDSLEPAPSKRGKLFNTKIEITAADMARIKEAEKLKKSGERIKVKLYGNKKTAELLESFNATIAKNRIENRLGMKLVRSPLLSEAFKEFIEDRSIEGKDDYIKYKTRENYSNAVEHLKKVCGDKQVHKYSEKDLNDLLIYFNEYQRKVVKKNEKGEKIITFRPLSQNSKSIYTRALNTLFNYFESKKIIAANPVSVVSGEEKDPDPIPTKDIKVILDYLYAKKDSPHHFNFIYFLFLTGCRPSSAVVQLKENIDFKNKFIKIENIKTGQRKKSRKRFYKFPLYEALYKLLNTRMGITEGSSGRLFPEFNYSEKSYTSGLSFWDRDIKSLYSEGKIDREYIMKQIRPTFSSYAINVLQMNLYTVKNLLNHESMKTTDKFYVDFEISQARTELENETIYKIE